MLADDLVRPIALHPLGAGVPVGDDAGRIEHVDGVVDDAFDEQPEAALALAQRLLGRHPFGDVAGDLGKADQAALAVADRLDDGVRPEAAAVLADPPPFGLEMPFRLRLPEGVRRPAGGLVLGHEELREMLADDLARPIALELLRAGVPADDEAGRIEHVDRIVGDGVDQQLQPQAVVDGGGLCFSSQRICSATCVMRIEPTSRSIPRPSGGPIAPRSDRDNPSPLHGCRPMP